MNSQKKQSSKRATGIKTDKYGVPLNYGNYKNGRLVVKKGGGGGRGKGGGRGGDTKSGSSIGGKNSVNNRSGGDRKSTNQSSNGGNKKGRSSNQQSQSIKSSNNNKEQTIDLHVASVGLTGEAHNVIKEALLSSSTSLSNTNLQSLSDSYHNNDNDNDNDNNMHATRTVTSSITSNTNTSTNTNKNNDSKHTATTTTRRPKNRLRSSPDLKPPPMITGCNDSMGPMGDIRRNLPVYNFKDALLKTIADNRVTVVEGETGSGKTTQVPQFCLEDAATRGVPCNIIIAQPRRISAMSVAERVADERGEQIGKTVGYTIRLESKANTNTRLLFCTTGILLKRLEEDPTLHNVTHVFVDEVHERSIESDFLLMVLRDMLPKRTSDRPLKIVLMSATLDASLFHDYFWDAPSLKFPGRTFPVTELYLEDILDVTGHVVKGNEDWCQKGGGGAGSRAKRGGGGGNKKDDANKKPGDWTCMGCQANNFARNQACFKCKKPKQNDHNTSSTTSITSGGGGRQQQQSTKNGNNILSLEDRDDMELTSQELIDRYAQYSSNTQAALRKLDHNVINYDLVVDTIQWLCKLKSPLDAVNYLKSSNNVNNKNNNKKIQQQNTSNNSNDGDSKVIDTTSSAILVFLPGIKEITTLRELLVKSMSSPADREWVLPIHSTIPPEEQRLVFTRPPKGVRKVVLATNIAETAITIDDVAFVVDTGRMKENRYDPLKRMSVSLVLYQSNDVMCV